MARDASHPAPPRPLGRVLGDGRGRPHHRRRRAIRDDADPSPLLDNFLDAIQGPAHGSPRPAVRRGWLEHGPGPDERRGADDFVEVELGTRRSTSWPASCARVRDRARQRVDLRRLLRLGQRRPLPPRAEPAAPVPQLHRRLHRRRSARYSLGASEVLLPHVVGGDATRCCDRATTWKAILEHTDLVVAFGGMNIEERVREPGRRDPPHAATGARRGRPAGASTSSLFSPLRSDLPEPRGGDVAPGACPAPTPR